MDYEIYTTLKFDKWLKSVKDSKVQDRLTQRISNMGFGHFGDSKQLSKDLFELRFFFGAGYRIYYTIQNKKVILLLCGGDKKTQSKNIELAKKLLNNLG
ncbi:MAG TPA: addiction module antitoxin RelB [Thiomicrospira sp.]|nr:addiction module antitoxin RelB [Thiomicrospira sp.]